jgi:hypothetical protein
VQIIDSYLILLITVFVRLFIRCHFEVDPADPQQIPLLGCCFPVHYDESWLTLKKFYPKPEQFRVITPMFLLVRRLA